MTKIWKLAHLTPKMTNKTTDSSRRVNEMRVDKVSETDRRTKKVKGVGRVLMKKSFL